MARRSPKGVGLALAALPADEIARMIKDLEAQMKRAAKELEFEKAARCATRLWNCVGPR